MEKFREKLTAAEEGLPSYRKIIRLPDSIGDWTTLRPPREIKKKITSGLRGFDRLSEESIEQAHLIHYQFFCDFIKNLSKTLETSIKLDSVEAIQTYYMDFIRKSVQPLVHLNINLTDQSHIYLFIDLSLANSIINRSLSNVDSKGSMPRSLTEAEEEVFLVAINESLMNLISYFGNVFEISDISIISSPSPNIETSLNPNDTFIAFQAETSIAGQQPSKISIGYVYSLLRAIMEKNENIPKKQINYKLLPAAVMDAISVNLKAVLGTSYITTKELNELDEGDIIVTETRLDCSNKISIGDQFEIYGQAGIKNGKICMQICGKSQEPRELSEISDIQEEQIDQNQEELTEEPFEEQPEASEEDTGEVLDQNDEELTEEENIFGDDFSEEKTKDEELEEDKEFDLG